MVPKVFEILKLYSILALVYLGLNMFISNWYVFGYLTQIRLDLTIKSCTAKLYSESVHKEGQINEI